MTPEEFAKEFGTAQITDPNVILVRLQQEIVRQNGIVLEMNARITKYLQSPMMIVKER